MRVSEIKRNEQEQIFERALPYRYRLIYQIGCQTGLRISDILNLKRRDIQKANIVIKEQKTKKEKEIVWPKALREELKIWAKIAQNRSNKRNPYLFPSGSSVGHISRQAVFKSFKRTAKLVGVKENIGTHSMRKRFACESLLNGATLEQIQKELNHTHKSDTLLYVLDVIFGEKE